MSPSGEKADDEVAKSPDASGGGPPVVPPPSDTIESTPSSRPSSTTTIMVLTSMIMLGLGCIGGYGVFHSVFRHRYADVMDEAERSHNATLQVMHQKLLSAVDDHKRCMDDDSRLQEVHDLRGRLESQSDIKSFLSSTKQREIAAKVDELQHRLGQKDDELSAARDEAAAFQSEVVELEKRLAEHQEQLDNMMRQELLAIQDDFLSLQELHDDVTNHLGQRQSLMCRQL